MNKTADELFMKEALKLAEPRKGLTHPNPTVGAVIVKNGKVIGKGYHKKAGMPHAEREAINDAVKKGYNIEGSTMYVTLEPCFHYGRTPPCTEAIIDSRIKRIVIATVDPNPQVSGKGVEILNKHGIETVVGILQEEAKKLNEDFFVYIKKKRPFIHLKIAQSLDGKIATRTGSSKWITSEESRKYVHQLRKESTAVMVGTNTALKDNPNLTVRHIETERQPLRVVLDKDLKIPEDYNLFNNEAKTVLFTSNLADIDKIKRLEDRGVQIVRLPLKNGKFKLYDILENLYSMDVIHLLVEGGRDLITQFLQEKLFDKISVFIAPKIIGEDGISSFGKLGVNSVDKSINLHLEDIKRFGDDILLQLRP
ncbi:bifunctional diaminohydroxyphosphoribosylaminopyrimidine deaminase/5-amino-6-(5-phosphoribosylamino)uracil reductase RibD [Persephonella sp.]